MLVKNINILLSLFVMVSGIFVFTLFVSGQQGAPSTTPTASSTLFSSECSDLVILPPFSKELVFDVTNFDEEGYQKKVREIIKKLLEEIFPNYLAFVECTYPTSFKCNKDKCNALIREGYRVSILPMPSSGESIFIQEKKGNGKIVLDISYISMAKIGLPPRPPAQGANEKEMKKYKEDLDKWMSKLLDELFLKILEKLAEETDKIRKNNPCPDGYTQAFAIFPDHINYQIKYGLTGITLTIPYSYIVACIKVDNLKNVKFKLDASFEKECVEKDVRVK